LDTGEAGTEAGAGGEAAGLDTGEAGNEVGAGGEAAGGADAGGGVFSAGMATVRFSSWVGWEIDVIFSRSIVVGKHPALNLLSNKRQPHS
jgi:hypothetical protein